MQIKSSAIVFGTKEWKDSISPFFLGLQQLKDIRNARIKSVYGIDCLELELKESILSVRTERLARIYLKLVGHKIYVPLLLLDISRLDLESQFLHLETLISKSQVKIGFSADFDRITKGRDAEKNPASTGKSIFSHIRGDVKKDSELPPELEAHPIFAEVARRKAEFHEKGLDRLLCELFVDFVRDLPDRTKEVSKRIPEGVYLIRHRSEGPEYEEVEFSWENKNLQMGLRTNLEEGTEALLSLAVDSEVKVGLKVGVEIGTLESRELERYIPGEWETSLRQLEKALKRPKDEPKEAEDTRKKAQKVEDLKKNFGLKDD